MSTRLVAVDLGGTHARFALAEVAADGAIALDPPVTLQTRDHASLAAAWHAFAERSGAPLPTAAAIAVAAPVGGETITLTNNPWVIRPAELAGQIGVERLTLLNDFAAVGHAVARAGEEHFVTLAGPDVPLPGAGTLAVVGPGTGLGVAHVWRDGAGFYRVQATEGGHIDFAPLDPVEDAVLARLREQHRRVSAERVVSGPGLVEIHATLAALGGVAIAPLDDRTLWQRGLDGSDRLAADAVERFCLSLGAFAGDIALAQGASGVVIAGGLGLRLKDHLLHSGFAHRFTAKGRFAGLLATLPVKLITHPQPGLFGAAAAFAKEHLS